MIYTLELLQKDYQKGKRHKYVFFWGAEVSADGSIGASCLSQWWMQDFMVDNIIYCCAEQYMMAEKARLFNDEEMHGKIMEARFPKEMKAYGRAVRRFDKEVWDSNCYDIVKKASKAKFSQNSDLCSFLIGTKGRTLVEASPMDRIWGIGMGKSNPDAENPMKWRGKNLLGFALTEARDELIKEMS